MNNITKILASLAIIAAAPFVTIDDAKASECVRGDGFTICASLESRNGRYNRWNVTLINSYTTERMNVTCYGKDVDTWKSEGGLSQEEANYLAEHFCAL